MGAHGEQDIRTFGQIIRERRIELGMTQEALAERVGERVRQSDISRMERDYITLPRRERLEALANALDLTSGDLLMRSGWITTEQRTRLDSPGTEVYPAPAPRSPHDPGPADEVDDRLTEMLTGVEAEDSPGRSSDLTHAIARARKVSGEIEELLRTTSSTVENARRHRRSFG